MAREKNGPIDVDAIKSKAGAAGSAVAGTAMGFGSRVLRFFKTLILVLGAFSVGFVACFGATKFGLLPSFEPPVLTQEHTTITVTQLEKIVEPAADLITMRYCYTDADSVDSSKQLCGIDVPLTRDLVVFTYKGFVGVGFDVSKMGFEVVDSEDGGKGEITVTIPEMSVIQNEIDTDSFDYHYQEHSIFNQKGMDYITDILSDLKEKAVERALSDESFMAEAKENAQVIIQSLLDSAHVNDYYNVTFVFADEGGQA